MKYLVAYTFKKGEQIGTGAMLNCEFAHDPPTAEDVQEMQKFISERQGTELTVITNWLPLSSNTHNCYNCGYGGDGEEVSDRGHCWLHNGEPDFEQPDKNLGCDEWKQRDW